MQMSLSRVVVLVPILAFVACTGGGSGAVGELPEPNNTEYAQMSPDGGAFHGRCSAMPDEDRFAITPAADTTVAANLTVEFAAGDPGIFLMLFGTAVVQ